MTCTAAWSSAHLPAVALNRWVSQVALEQQSKLAYRIAHAIGNWSTAVIGNTERWREECRSTACAETGGMRARRILSAMEQALELRRHLEAFVSGATPPDDEPLDLARLLSASEMEHIRAELPRPMRHCHVSAPAQHPPASLSQAAARHCLKTLLANAADAMVDRSGEVRVDAGCATLDAAALEAMLRHPAAAPGRWLYLTVEDEGEGLTEAQYPQLFAPGYSTRLRQDGFGLAAVFGIVCRKGRGAIGLWTRPAEGTRWTLCWPALNAPPSVAPGDGTS